MQENTPFDPTENHTSTLVTDELLGFLKTAIQKNIAYESILLYLSEKQYTKQTIYEATKQLEIDWEEKQHANSTTRSVGFAWIIAGIAILMLPINHYQHQLAYIIAYSILLFGCLKWIHGWIRNNQFKKQILFIKNWKSFLKREEDRNLWSSDSSSAVSLSYTIKEDIPHFGDSSR